MIMKLFKLAMCPFKSNGGRGRSKLNFLLLLFVLTVTLIHYNSHWSQPFTILPSSLRGVVKTTPPPPPVTSREVPLAALPIISKDTVPHKKDPDEDKADLASREPAVRRPVHGALIISANTSNAATKVVTTSLQELRFEYQTITYRAIKEILATKQLFDIVIIASTEPGKEMDTESREKLHEYCRKLGIGILSLNSLSDVETNQTDIYNIPTYPIINLNTLVINDEASLWRITKDGGMVPETCFRGQNNLWIAFDSPDEDYEPLAFAITKRDANTKHIVALLDSGKKDKVKKVILGNTLSFWLMHSVFLDALYYLSNGVMAIPVRRNILVDIDDVFIHGKGLKMNAWDVQTLLDLQTRLANSILGFKFNLGFSGKMYLDGNEPQKAGDLLLIENKDKFDWFSHSYEHVPPHLLRNTSSLEQSMIDNKHFAEILGLPMASNYAVSPHHSGIYPVQESLYALWKEIWNIKVTSTSRYTQNPKVGFIHADVKVLPRRTFTIYSHHTQWKTYSGGIEALDKHLQGGIIYRQILYNPVLLFMFHAYNFMHDRIGNYALQTAVDFTRQWTNLKLVRESPLITADRYFSMYPQDREVLWQNPCARAFIDLYKNVSRCGEFGPPLPNTIMVGPNHIVTSGIHLAIVQLPMVLSNMKTPDTYHDLKFFSDTNVYKKGVEWYMDNFPKDFSENQIILEKSWHYFASKPAPHRMKMLRPNAKVIIVLPNPVNMAHACYQRKRSNGDKQATSHSLSDVCTKSGNVTHELLALRNECIEVGLYASILHRWLQQYPARQIILVDGDNFLKNPVAALNDLQRALGITQYREYQKSVRLDTLKGFMCSIYIPTGESICVGEEDHKPISKVDRETLTDYYRASNQELWRLLTDHALPLPSWLDKTVSVTTTPATSSGEKSTTAAQRNDTTTPENS